MGVLAMNLINTGSIFEVFVYFICKYAIKKNRKKKKGKAMLIMIGNVKMWMCMLHM